METKKFTYGRKEPFAMIDNAYNPDAMDEHFEQKAKEAIKKAICDHIDNSQLLKKYWNETGSEMIWESRLILIEEERFWLKMKREELEHEYRAAEQEGENHE